MCMLHIIKEEGKKFYTEADWYLINIKELDRNILEKQPEKARKIIGRLPNFPGLY